MVNQSTFPIISVEGVPYELGYQYGSKCKRFVEELLGMYRALFKREAGLEWNQVLGLSKSFIPFIEEYDPDAIEEMQGIAKATENTLEDVVAINASSELSFLTVSGGIAKGSTGCTTFAATPEATQNANVLVGQNFDWYPAAQKSSIILKKKKKGKPNCVLFVEAGLLGRGGLNSAGVGSVGNGLVTDKMRVGVPVVIMTNKMLSAESLTDAMGMLLSAQRASSTNRLIASASGECVDIELTPDEYHVVFPDNGIIAHTNHFIVFDPNIKDIWPTKPPWHNSFTRLHRANKLLAAEWGNITIETFKKIFRDHLDKPDSICMHLDERLSERQRVQTNASVIMDISAKAFYIAKGPPCENEYAAIDLKDIL